MALLRAKIQWTIPGAGTAFTVLHFSSIAGAGFNQAATDEVIARCNAFITTVKANIPSQVTLRAPGELEEIDQTTGDLVLVRSGTQPAAQAGTAAAAAGWAAPSGGVLSWSTADIRNSRRIRGRTFIVPMSNEVYDVDGTIKSVPYGVLGTAATNLREPGTETRLAIWGRPSLPGATDGVMAPVTGHRVPDMVAILTTRRS